MHRVCPLFGTSLWGPRTHYRGSVHIILSCVRPIGLAWVPSGRMNDTRKSSNRWYNARPSGDNDDGVVLFTRHVGISSVTPWRAVRANIVPGYTGHGRQLDTQGWCPKITLLCNERLWNSPIWCMSINGRLWFCMDLHSMEKNQIILKTKSTHTSANTKTLTKKQQTVYVYIVIRAIMRYYIKRFEPWYNVMCLWYGLY